MVSFILPTEERSMPALPPNPPSPQVLAGAGLLQSFPDHLRHLFLPFSAGNFPPHPHAFPPLLKACAALRLLPLGLSLHRLSIILSLSADAHIASSLLHFYSKTSRAGDARKVFDAMPLRNVVPWSAIIAAYSRSGDADTAFSMYRKMLWEGVRPNSVTLLGLLSGLSQLDQVRCLHGCAVQYGFESDQILVNSMMNVYGKCGRLDFAGRLFQSMVFKDIVSWNSMIAGYSRHGESPQCVELFKRMRLAGMNPDCQTYGSLISSIGNHNGASIQLGKVVHALVVTSGFQSDIHLHTALVSLYLKFKDWEYAFLAFDQALDKDVVAWTAMVSGLVQNNQADKALIIFHRMMRSGVTPSTSTIASALSACAQLSLPNLGASIHGVILRQRLELDIAANNSLVTMYAKSGRLGQCQLVFEAMHARDLVSWNAIVSGHAQNGHLSEAFLLFQRMRLALQRPDTITLVALLQGSSSLGALKHGKLVHSIVIRQELKQCISLDTSLVDMYSKCGDLESAQRCFSLLQEQDLVSWSAIIAGYGSHGMGRVALEMYWKFLLTGMEPNDVMFLAVLSACSHSGLVSDGLAIFKSMQEEFSVVPSLEHCACIIDLLSRAGRIEEAVEFIRTMSPRPNADILGILLDACRVYGHNRLVEEVAKEIIALRPDTAGSYVQLARGYAALNRWDGVGETLAQMRTLGLKKAPGWSFIELNGSITTFFANHSSHLQCEEMNFMLEILCSEMREIEEKLCA